MTSRSLLLLTSGLLLANGARSDSVGVGVAPGTASGEVLVDEAVAHQAGNLLLDGRTVVSLEKVARLTIAPQDDGSPAGRELAETIERAAFDPWRALEQRRPLGDVMRARKVVYYESQKGRA